jgi:hypothetical protein
MARGSPNLSSSWEPPWVRTGLRQGTRVQKVPLSCKGSSKGPFPTPFYTYLSPTQIRERSLTSICACTASWVTFTDCTAWGEHDRHLGTPPATREVSGLADRPSLPGIAALLGSGLCHLHPTWGDQSSSTARVLGTGQASPHRTHQRCGQGQLPVCLAQH